MISKLFLALFIALVAFQSVKAQTAVTLDCEFFFVADNYGCLLSGVTIEDNGNVDVIIGGQHWGEYDDLSVHWITFTDSNVPFFIPQLFTTFPNVFQLFMAGSGLARVPRGSFANASNLQYLMFIQEPQLQELPENVFVGASQLLYLEIVGNSVNTVHENAFTGLNQLQILYLDSNEIRVLSPHVFQPLTAAAFIRLSENLLETIDERLFAGNPQLEFAALNQNRITSIGRAFLDNTPNLRTLDMRGNVCSTGLWEIGVNGTTIETVRQDLEICFSNPIDPPEEDVKHFTIELRGHLIIRDADGVEIGRL